MNRNQLIPIHKLFYEEQNNRENEIHYNIYNYCNENQFNQAVLLIGAEHRNSIIDKVTKLNHTEKLKLNWKFYGDQGF
jgi:hypothetical protein